jgi:hypothetical protein
MDHIVARRGYVEVLLEHPLALVLSKLFEARGHAIWFVAFAGCFPSARIAAVGIVQTLHFAARQVLVASPPEPARLRIPPKTAVPVCSSSRLYFFRGPGFRVVGRSTGTGLTGRLPAAARSGAIRGRAGITRMK